MFLVLYVKNHEKTGAALRFDEVYTENGCSFDLYAVVQHIGDSRKEGHYVSYIKSSTGIWHKFDDENVTATNFEKISKLKIYIWIYVKQDSGTAANEASKSPAKQTEGDVISLMLE